MAAGAGVGLPGPDETPATLVDGSKVIDELVPPGVPPATTGFPDAEVGVGDDPVPGFPTPAPVPVVLPAWAAGLAAEVPEAPGDVAVVPARLPALPPAAVAAGDADDADPAPDATFGELALHAARRSPRTTTPPPRVN